MQLHKSIPRNLAGRHLPKEANVSLSLIGCSRCYDVCYWLTVRWRRNYL